MASSLQVTITILSREIGDNPFEFEWTWPKVASKNYSQKICKQAIIRLLLAYSFWKILVIGQNLKHVHVTFILFMNIWSTFNSFDLLWILIFTTSNMHCTYMHTPSGEIKWKRYAFSLVSDVDVEESRFFNAEFIFKNI